MLINMLKFIVLLYNYGTYDSLHMYGTYISNVHNAGGVVAGLVSDLLQARAFTSVASLVLAIPSVSIKLLSLIHVQHIIL